MELYFDDCYDLLNKKMRVAISGFGKNAKKAATGYMAQVTQRDKDGKWIPPFQRGANGAWGLKQMREEAKEQRAQVAKLVKVVDRGIEASEWKLPQGPVKIGNQYIW